MLMYSMTIGLLIYGFSKIKNYESIGLKPTNKFTIIVPFRNEAENLPVLLESLSKLNYPNNLFEVILVDDESEERIQIADYRLQIAVIKNIRVSNSPKKDAISTAMKIVKTNWVITTDADCIANKNWLLTLDNYIQNHDVAMIAGAVSYDCENSLLHHFQRLDLASLQGATMGSFGLGKGFMCNGANFAYTKTMFETLNGFEGNETIASGDDVFLLQKAVVRFPEKVHYLKSEYSIIRTKPLNNWKSLFYQRVRWAAKTRLYQNNFAKVLGIIVFVGNLKLVLGFGLWVLGYVGFQNLVFFFLSKFIVDTILLYKTNTFLTKTRMRYLLLSSLLYPFFSVTVAFYSLFGKYEWKGRVFKN